MRPLASAIPLTEIYLTSIFFRNVENTLFMILLVNYGKVWHIQLIKGKTQLFFSEHYEKLKEGKLAFSLF